MTCFTTYHLVTLSPAALRLVVKILHPQERRAGLSLNFNGADEFRRLIQCPRNLATWCIRASCVPCPWSVDRNSPRASSQFTTWEIVTEGSLLKWKPWLLFGLSVSLDLWRGTNNFSTSSWRELRWVKICYDIFLLKVSFQCQWLKKQSHSALPLR